MSVIRIFLAVSLFAFSASLGFGAQGPKGAGADIEAEPVQRTKPSKPGPTPPLYSVPMTMSWWHGGGPGPAGAGAE
jgi:hypothetical protein